MTDDAIDIPPTMRRTVALLRANGFVVRDSGDVGGKEDHAHAFVAMLVERPALAGEADRAFRLLTSRGVDVPTPNDESDGSEIFSRPRTTRPMASLRSSS